MLADLRGRGLWAALGASGAVTALGQAPFGLPLLALLGLGAGLALIQSAGPRPAFWRALVFGLGYFLVCLHWIVEPFLVDVARHGWMAPFALVLLSGGMALFWAGGAALGSWLGGDRLWRRLVAMALALTGVEMIRAVIFTGFPWAMLSTIWTDTPLRALAAWIGPYGLVLGTLLLGAGLALAASAPGRLRAMSLAGAAGMLGLGWVLGGQHLAGSPVAPAAEAAPDRPLVRVIQPNAAQHLKWRADMIPVFWQRKLDLTAAPAARPPDVVVWPEVTLPYQWGNSPGGDLQVATAAGGAVTLVGAQRFVGTDLHNAIGVIAPNGRPAGIYDKFHLVPFGEYFPGGALAEWLGLQGLATDMLGGFSPGPGPQLLDLSAFGLGQVLPLICYEAIFPRHGFAPGGAADWMVQATNDAWFGEFAGPQQHLAQARMRAVEQGRALVRAANTGISAVIDPAGRIIAQVPLGQAGFADAVLPAPRPTLYARTGNLPVGAVTLLGLVALAVLRWRGA